MGKSLHRRAADMMALEWAETGDGAIRLATTYRMINDEQLRDQRIVLGQPYSGWDMGQLFAVHCLWTLFTFGHLAAVEFELGETPQKDVARKANQDALRHLPEGVVATVNPTQRGADSDGVLVWNAELSGVIIPKGGHNEVTVQPGRAPLEIGHTDASATCLHLARTGSVARWPYKDGVLTLLVAHPRGILQRWRIDGPPDEPVLIDLCSFLNRIAATRTFGRRLSSSMGVGVGALE
ncbi:MAG TPA: hypothetical protein VGL93_14445 [Streptosporangiaceae bacterium]